MVVRRHSRFLSAKSARGVVEELVARYVLLLRPPLNRFTHPESGRSRRERVVTTILLLVPLANFRSTSEAKSRASPNSARRSQSARTSICRRRTARSLRQPSHGEWHSLARGRESSFDRRLASSSDGPHFFSLTRLRRGTSLYRNRHLLCRLLHFQSQTADQHSRSRRPQ